MVSFPCVLTFLFFFNLKEDELEHGFGRATICASRNTICDSAASALALSALAVSVLFKANVILI